MSRPFVLRQASRALRAAPPSIPSKRFASTFPARRRGRAAGTLLRLGLAGAAVYYYNTATVFAEEPSYATPDTHRDAETYTTVDTIAAQRRAQARASATTAETLTPQADSSVQIDGSPQDLEEEAAQQGAFNEETGEINWDCPCLGGMADGPCGEQFKAAFSCFVFSKDEPKGIDCIEHFKTMQNCFREHPDVYGTELEPEEAEEPETGIAHSVDVARDHIDSTVDRVADNITADASAAAQEVSSVTAQDTTIKQNAARKAASPSTAAADDLVPKQWHDSRGESTK